MHRIHGILVVLCCLSLSLSCGGTSAPCSPACLAGWTCVDGSCVTASGANSTTGSSLDVLPTGNSSSGGNSGSSPQTLGGTTGGGTTGAHAEASGGSTGAPPVGGSTGASCTPNCAGRCAGADDGCGSTCRTGSCHGCCDGNNECQPGDVPSACGGNGEACAACASGPCLPGDAGSSACCVKTPAPTCSTVTTPDGCGGSYAAVCQAGETCYGGICCTPSCTDKCPYASDGCGGVCPVPATGNPGCTYDGKPGCCDSNGVCQPGSASSACGNGGACQECLGGQSCNVNLQTTGLFACCVPGEGCPESCGDPNLLDSCGNFCPVTGCSHGCCDAAGDCETGTADDACGSGGGTCTACNGNSCVAGIFGIQICGQCQDGQTRQIACDGSCGTQIDTCVNGGWQSGSCVPNCGSGCCDASQTSPLCAGTTTAACGSGNGTCVDCNTLFNGHDQGYGLCQSGTCCLSKGAPIYSGTPASACCSGSTSSNPFSTWCN
ncbi:MAG TPA: hypothetical protein VMB50_07845 [Myxococcales bacterium]|nr:hypothetical protein [Myxococcales bacterium]